MMKKNYYAVLGVEQGADEKEIRKAFRKLAKKYHPDTNQGNQEAERRFKEINEAYAVLSDPKKKKLYDTYGEMGLQEGFDPQAYEAYRRAGYTQHGFGDGASFGGHGGFGSFDGFGGAGSRGGYSSFRFDGSDDDMSDLFSGLFGGRRRESAKGRDLETEVSVSFEEAALGCERTIRVNGADGGVSSLQVHIPAGIDEGQKVRLKGKGSPGRGGVGDLFLKVHILPKKDFERKGQDIYVTVRIPFVTAVLGGEALVPTLDGQAICRIPAGTQSGSRIRLKGKGIVSMRNSSLKGDEYVVVRILVPTDLSEQEKNKLREFEALSAGKGGRAGSGRRGSGHAA